MSFAEIAGHDRVLETLRRSLRCGKLPHAYIFEGSPGTGRRKTALALVQAMFCTVGLEDACGECPSCRKVINGNHGDIHFVEPLPEKKDISIEQLRELQRELSLRPYEAVRKVCLMEPAERMNRFSANSFLKTLEEPPGNALLILLTENADMLLPTIRSRCQLIRFAPLSADTILTLLVKRGMDSATAALTAPMAQGSMMRALELDNEALVERRELLLKHLENLRPDRISTIFDASEQLSGNRDENLEMLDLMLSFVRDMIHILVGRKDITNKNMYEQLALLAKRASLEKTLALADDISATRRCIYNNANAKLALDILFMKMAGVPDTTACKAA